MPRKRPLQGWAAPLEGRTVVCALEDVPSRSADASLDSAIGARQGLLMGSEGPGLAPPGANTSPRLYLHLNSGVCARGVETLHCPRGAEEGPGCRVAAPSLRRCGPR